MAALAPCPPLLVMSILATTIYYLAFAKGTVLMLSSVAGMLSGAIPLFTFVTAFIFLREEPINRRTAGGTLLGFLGILLIARPWDQNLGAVDMAGVFWIVAGSSASVRRLSMRESSSVRLDCRR